MSPSQINGKGGGRPDMAQGGGDDGPALQAALEAVPQWVAERLTLSIRPTGVALRGA